MTTAVEPISKETPAPFTAGMPTSLAAAFADVCRRRGDAVAVRCAQEQITFADLDHRAHAVAQALRDRGIGRGSLVAILLPRGIDMIAAMLGVCRAGAAYLPLDLTFPDTRVCETLGDAQPALVLTDTPERAALVGDTASALRMADIGDEVIAPIAPAGKPDDLAYVIYTSGSTGQPKGVMVSQHNVLRLLSQTEAWFRFDEHDVWTMFHSFAFDFSVWEIWGCLLTGGTLVVVPYETSRSPDEFHALLSRERVTVLNQTPTAFGLFCQSVEGRNLPLALRYVIFGGEALNLRSLRRWVERFGDEQPQLINMYGITETTVHVTYRRIRTADIEVETDSLIGVPIPDLKIHLLDEDRNRVHRGSVGEMYIAGAGVAMGYLHRPELTAERFIPNFIDGSGGTLYRSGDLARRRPDGELVYLGRADRQVKINGFRVEPGEIEAALAEFPGVQQACVTPVEAAEGALLLAAYFVAAHKIDQAAVAAMLNTRLPPHMRPTCFVQLSSLPLTVNGKVNREALPVPALLVNEFGPSAVGKPLARLIAEVWASVLQVPSVAESDNFFDSGGTSLQLLALRTALQQKFNRQIPVLWFFEHTSPAALAAQLSPDATPQAAAPAQSVADKQRQAFARARALRSPLS